MAETLTFNMDAVLQRLLEECYSLLAALPLFLLALVVVAVFWLLGSWLADRCWTGLPGATHSCAN
mgnify:CR=1 FL=1